MARRVALTPKRSRSRQACRRVGTHDAVYVVRIEPESVQAHGCEPTPTILLVHDQLRDPADVALVATPATDKRVSRKSSVHANSGVGALGVAWQVKFSESAR